MSPSMGCSSASSVRFSVCTTIMRNESDCGNKSFLVGVGLHQGSTLSRVLFIMKDEEKRVGWSLVLLASSSKQPPL